MKLFEGVDYTMEEGKMVFTRDFLLKRGYCCNSKCRNCPYKSSENDTYKSTNIPREGTS